MNVHKPCCYQLLKAPSFDIGKLQHHCQRCSVSMRDTLIAVEHKDGKVYCLDCQQTLNWDCVFAVMIINTEIANCCYFGGDSGRYSEIPFPGKEHKRALGIRCTSNGAYSSTCEKQHLFLVDKYGFCRTPRCAKFEKVESVVVDTFRFPVLDDHSFLQDLLNGKVEKCKQVLSQFDSTQLDYFHPCETAVQQILATKNKEAIKLFFQVYYYFQPSRIEDEVRPFVSELMEKDWAGQRNARILDDVYTNRTAISYGGSSVARNFKPAVGNIVHSAALIEILHLLFGNRHTSEVNVSIHVAVQGMVDHAVGYGPSTGIDYLQTIIHDLKHFHQVHLPQRQWWAKKYGAFSMKFHDRCKRDYQTFWRRRMFVRGLEYIVVVKCIMEYADCIAYNHPGQGGIYSTSHLVELDEWLQSDQFQRKYVLPRVPPS